MNITLYAKKGDIYIANLNTASENIEDILTPKLVLVMHSHPNGKVTAVKINELKEKRTASNSNVVSIKCSKYLDINDSIANPEQVLLLSHTDLLKYIGTVDYSIVSKVKKLISEEIRKDPKYFPKKNKPKMLV